jgi:2-dehydro-3-deoxyphosphogluconate aldolase / (4S)-4-hydroxy-2-oxoglutarate aldolase
MTDEQATMRTRDSGPGAEPFAHWAEFFARALSEVPLVAILRGLGADEAVRAAREAWDAGVPLVEVTVERPEGVDALGAVVEAAPEGHTVGAGTVTTPERLDLARKAGARFAIAPGLDDDTVRSAQEHDLPFLPGVATPSEAARALALGVNTVKVFPASILGPEWIRAVGDPLPELRMVATGGINADNAADYLGAGALGVGMGSALRGAGLPRLVAALRR